MNVTTSGSFMSPSLMSIYREYTGDTGEGGEERWVRCGEGVEAMAEARAVETEEREESAEGTEHFAHL